MGKTHQSNHVGLQHLDPLALEHLLLYCTQLYCPVQDCSVLHCTKNIDGLTTAIQWGSGILIPQALSICFCTALY